MGGSFPPAFLIGEESSTAMQSFRSLQTTVAVERKFRRLVEQWRNEPLFTSSSSEKVMHPAYQRIIDTGGEFRV
jgi:hypothetical protein